MSPTPTHKTRRHKSVSQLPHGHVTTTQLKRDARAGIEYFWSRRPAALRPPDYSYLDFSHRSKTA